MSLGIPLQCNHSQQRGEDENVPWVQMQMLSLSTAFSFPVGLQHATAFIGLYS